MRYFLLLSILFFSSLTPAATPPEIQLATLYHQNINIQEYWISEKLDGVRAYWDGKNLISRRGNIFNSPAWFSKGFPDHPIDGELWIARQQFELVSGIVRTQKATDQAWQKITFMIFDLPASEKDFTARIAAMKEIVKKSASPYLQMINQRKVANNAQLQQLLTTVLAQGGEGLMLHKGSAYYQTKRSKDLMKLKKYHDGEAVVLQHFPGKGRNTGRMGAILVETAEGITFKIGSGFSDQERENPPAIGTTITYQYSGKTKNNIPRFATFMRIREAL